jgi:hypothetical protein
MKSLDNHGRYTLYGVFEESKDGIDKGLKEFPIGVSKMKRITWRVFSKVIRTYFTIAFKELVDGYSVTLLNKFGILNVVKTKCVRYNPTKIAFYKDEQGELVRKKIKLKTSFGYWYFVFWDAPKKLRQYRFHIDLKYKIQYMVKVGEGFDYLDYSLNDYGRNASNTYIHQIK